MYGPTLVTVIGKEGRMIVFYTTERAYPYGVLRSTNASKVKVILEEKGLPYRMERLRPGDR